MKGETTEFSGGLGTVMKGLDLVRTECHTRKAWSGCFPAVLVYTDMLL